MTATGSDTGGTYGDGRSLTAEASRSDRMAVGRGSPGPGASTPGHTPPCDATIHRRSGAEAVSDGLDERDAGPDVSVPDAGTDHDSETDAEVRREAPPATAPPTDPRNP